MDHQSTGRVWPVSLLRIGILASGLWILLHPVLSFALPEKYGWWPLIVSTAAGIEVLVLILIGRRRLWAQGMQIAIPERIIAGVFFWLCAIMIVTEAYDAVIVGPEARRVQDAISAMQHKGPVLDQQQKPADSKVDWRTVLREHEPSKP